MSITSNIYTANFTFDEPFQLSWTGGEVLHAEKVVRVIPGKRMVVFGMWQNKPVVAKLFFDAHRAKHHIQKELAGIKVLQENKIPAPQLYYQSASKDERSHILLFERLLNAKTIEDLWQADIQEILPQLRSIILELATQHVLGVVQHDLHLNNFLVAEKHVYTLDGAQIELLPNKLDKKQSMNNIALFLSQLGAGVKQYQQELFLFYAKARGWIIKKDDFRELFNLIKKWNDERWQKYKKKIVRESSHFSCHKDFRSITVYDRAYAAPELLKFISQPETIFDQPNTKILKTGRSSTVVKVTIDQRDYVIKRYNIKNIFHYLRRCLRPTRAATSWRLAQKLKLFHIATASPVAYIEKRFLGLRGKSYYIMEYVPGENINEFFAHHSAENTKFTGMIKRVSTLLKNLTQVDITHGDLKSSNILVNAHEQPLLIDLDGAVEHTSPSSLRKAWRKEIKRFLKNFDENILVQELLREELDF